MTISKTLAPQILAIATDLNFNGKKILSSKIAVAESIIDQLKLTIEPDLLTFWLTEQKLKAKPAKAEKASNKLDPRTMGGNETAQRAEIPTISGKKFIITSAQNNTENASVFAQLQELAEQASAQLLVLPMYYNKRAFSAAVEDEKEYFNDAVIPYLLESDVYLCEDSLVKLAVSAAILPTAKNPISTATIKSCHNGERTTIVASPRLKQCCLPVVAGQATKTVWSTGTCTKYNYSRSRSGSEAESAHCFGGLLVEIDERGEPFVTNIVQALDGSICVQDLSGQLLTSGYTNTGKPVVVLGDLHLERSEPELTAQVHKWLRKTKPMQIVCHDAIHFESRNHHNIKDAKHWYKSKNSSVFSELSVVIEQLNAYAAIAPLFMVESNHNSAVDQWLGSMSVAGSIAKDTKNSKLFYLLQYLLCETIDNNGDDKALRVALENSDLTNLPKLSDQITWGDKNRAEIVYKVDLSNHGHQGANGAAKGLVNGLVVANMITGHTHSAAIHQMTAEKVQLVVGTVSSKNQGYNLGGASSWSQSSAILHDNGTAQQIFHRA